MPLKVDMWSRDSGGTSATLGSHHAETVCHGRRSYFQGHMRQSVKQVWCSGWGRRISLWQAALGKPCVCCGLILGRRCRRKSSPSSGVGTGRDGSRPATTAQHRVAVAMPHESCFPQSSESFLQQPYEAGRRDTRYELAPCARRPLGLHLETKSQNLPFRS
jgi:hypothetical protein